MNYKKTFLSKSRSGDSSKYFKKSILKLRRMPPVHASKQTRRFKAALENSRVKARRDTEHNCCESLQCIRSTSNSTLAFGCNQKNPSIGSDRARSNDEAYPASMGSCVCETSSSRAHSQEPNKRSQKNSQLFEENQ